MILNNICPQVDVYKRQPFLPALERNREGIWYRTFPGSARHGRYHFAAFPPKLAETCILAGCPIGGIVLDPFFGSGTTGMVAKGLNPVSYTHLSIAALYRERSWYLAGGSNPKNDCPIRQSGKRRGAAYRTGVAAVSYTHLDVYKRQYGAWGLFSSRSR